MHNNEIINGLAAIKSVCEAYQSINKDVLDPVGFEKTACLFIESLCTENFTLTNRCSLNNGSGDEGISFGRVRIPFTGSDSMKNVLRKQIPQFVHDSVIEAEAKIDFSVPFSVLFDIETDAGEVGEITQQMLISMLKQNQLLHFRCADFVIGGNFFSSLHNMISLFPARTGGKVYTKLNEFSELVKSLETAASDAMEKLGSNYASVKEYNQENEININEYLTIVYLNSSFVRSDEFNRLRILVENGKRNGMSFILLGTQETVQFFSNSTDFQITYSNSDVLIGNKAKLPFNIQHIMKPAEDELKNMIASLQASEQIDTRYENHPQLHTEFFTMNSNAAVRIPFAVDKYNRTLYFEIGGDAPNHALIAGSTGSGKSVALHSLILQIIHNYHPDDVEIWAIDYKAVEFAGYMEHHTPHFRVIAHDTSKEFSLSLIDLLYEEYEKRQQKFLNANVKSINQYRRVCGQNSMPRIIVIIDEFQLMTQAVQEYSGNINYRERLENLLRLTRAMGISFVLCSQTIASGLSGLSDAARDQIGCRLCLKHQDDNEIRETLMLSGSGASDIVAKAKELRTGQGIYKRARWGNEYSPDGKAYEFLESHILFINDEIKKDMINTANELLQDNYVPKEEILARGNGRIPVSEKIRHPLVRFINNEYKTNGETIEWYPAAPTTLADSFCLEIDNTASENILLVGEADDLRESVVVHSVCGFLMNPNNRVVMSVMDENYPDRQRMIQHLKKIRSEYLTINVGICACLEVISDLKKIRPTPGINTIYIWYGLDKLKNELFLMNQDNTAETIKEVEEKSMALEELMADLNGFLGELNGTSTTVTREISDSKELTFEDCVSILRQAFEMGPENNKIHMAIFNNRKVMKKSGLIELDNFENRIGTMMSGDDSYELFGSSLAVYKTDENTVIYYAGSGSVIPLRPYLMPDENWFRLYNQILRS